MEARMRPDAGVCSRIQESTVCIQDVTVCFERAEKQLHNSQFKSLRGTGRGSADKGHVTVFGRIPLEWHHFLLGRQVKKTELD
jgi:hypothetical protein